MSEQTGVDATRRTRLANERTFLAWWRTALGTEGLAVGVGKVLPEVTDGPHWPYVAFGLIAIQIVHAVLSTSLKAPSRRVTALNSELASRMLHLVHAGRLTRIFGQEAREKAVFDTASDAVRRAAFTLHVRQGSLPLLSETLHAVTRLRGTVEQVPLGSLPKDGILVTDARTYD